MTHKAVCESAALSSGGFLYYYHSFFVQTGQHLSSIHDSLPKKPTGRQTNTIAYCCTTKIKSDEKLIHEESALNESDINE